MNKAKRRLQLSASIISVIGMLGVIVIFFIISNARAINVDEIYGDTGMPGSLNFMQAISMMIFILPGIIIDLIMFKEPHNEKTHKGLRITNSVLIGIYTIYFLFGSISLMTTSMTNFERFYGELLVFPIILLFISLLLFIISFCVGNPKKRKLFVEDADLKIQTICRLQQMNLITKEEAKHFIFIQTTK